MSGLFQDENTLPEPPPSGPGLFGDSAPAPAPSPQTTPREDAAEGRQGASQPAAQPPAAGSTPYRVLARKYRPTTFDDLIGQEAMVRILRNAFALGRIAHAWMLTGVRGVGKTTTARIIARALNCVGPDGAGGPTAEPCGVCPNCTAILADRHPDVVEMDAASRTGVDDVREIIDATRYRPLQARTKVFIVDEVHMLSRNAFNALLKTLEEPPPHVKFVFATTEIRKVPITVLSRCQRFDLRRVSVAELARHFGRIAAREGVAVAPDALDLIARAADGSVRDGLSLLDQAIAQSGAGTGMGDAAESPRAEAAGAQDTEPRVAGAHVTGAEVADMLGLADRSAVFDLLEAVMAGRPDEALAVTDRAHERGADLGVLLGDVLDLVHTLTRLKAVPALRDGPELPEAERTRGAALADRLSMPALGRAWQMLLKGAQEVEQATDRRAAAEMVLIRLCYVADLPPPGELMRRLQDGQGLQAPQGSYGAAAPVAPRAPSPAGAPSGDGHGPQGPQGSYGAATPAAPRAPSSVGAASGDGHGPQGPRGSYGAAAPVASRAPSPAGAPSGAGSTRAVANGAPAPAPVAAASPAPAAPPRLQSFRDVAALVAQRQEPVLHGHLLHAVHPVRFAPPIIELRPEPDAPRDLASRLAAILLEATGQRWTIALSKEAGEPTLAQRGAAAEASRRADAADHPLVRAILDAFPGARIESVRDGRADHYGLLPDPAPSGEPGHIALVEPDLPEFAPPDAEPADMPDD